MAVRTEQLCLLMLAGGAEASAAPETRFYRSFGSDTEEKQNDSVQQLINVDKNHARDLTDSSKQLIRSRINPPPPSLS